MIVTNRSKRNKRTGQTSPNKATHRIKPARNKKSKRKISKKLHLVDLSLVSPGD